MRRFSSIFILWTFFVHKVHGGNYMLRIVALGFTFRITQKL
jgi:hypothetical protein